jgi:hypothetical protein
MAHDIAQREAVVHGEEVSAFGLQWLFADAEPPPECPGDSPDERLMLAGYRLMQFACAV